MVALTLRARLLAYKREVKAKIKLYIVRKYLDSCVKSSNYCDRFLFYFNFLFF